MKQGKKEAKRNIISIKDFEDALYLDTISFENNKDYWNKKGVEIEKTNYTEKTVIFYNIEINDYIYFEGRLPPECHIHIKNSKIIGFGFIKCDWTKTNLLFENCEIQGLWITSCSTFGVIWIKNNSKFTELYIKNSLTKDIHIDNSTVDAFRIFRSSKIGFIKLKSSEIYSISVEENSLLKNIYVNECIIGKIYIQNSTTGFVEFFNCYAGIILTQSQIPIVYVKNCNLTYFTIELACKLETHIIESSINHLNFKDSIFSKDTQLSISNTKIYAIEMWNFSVLGNLYFREITNLKAPFIFDKSKVRLTNFIVMHEETLNLLRSKNNIIFSVWRMINSSLGKSEFVNCDFENFKIEYSNTKITEIFMAGKSINVDSISVYKESVNSIGYFEQKVGIFNQLKKIYEAQGDVFYGTIFHAKTLENQKKILDLSHNLLSNKSENNFERLTFWLNDISNKHGTSWKQSLIFILFVYTFSYLGFLWTNGVLFKFGNEFDPDLIGYYFVFLDISHKNEFLTPKLGHLPNSYSLFFNLIGKVLIGYGIYQLISAFRKFGKK